MSNLLQTVNNSIASQCKISIGSCILSSMCNMFNKHTQLWRVLVKQLNRPMVMIIGRFRPLTKSCQRPGIGHPVGVSYPPMPVSKLNAGVELYSLLRKLPVPLGRMACVLYAKEKTDTLWVSVLSLESGSCLSSHALSPSSTQALSYIVCSANYRRRH